MLLFKFKYVCMHFNVVFVIIKAASHLCRTHAPPLRGIGWCMCLDVVEIIMKNVKKTLKILVSNTSICTTLVSLFYK